MEKKKNMIQGAGIALACVGGSLFLLRNTNDLAVFWQWMFLLLMLGLVSIPLTTCLMPEMNSPMPFAMILGVLIPGFVTWTVGVWMHIPFSKTTCVIVMASYAICNAVLFLKQKKEGSVSFSIFGQIPVYGLLFFLMFLFWTYLIGFNPEAYGTEKFMDYAFLQKMLTSTELPPEDMWFSGKTINYYYGGQYYAAFLAKILCGKAAEAEFAYNMMRAVIPSLMFCGVFALVNVLLLDAGKEKRTASIFSAFSATVSVFAGNGHYILYGILKPMFAAGDKSSYWFPDATRYIGYNPVNEVDQTIHEFPCYSFVLGDLHAHMINIMFVILLVGVLYSFLKIRKKDGSIPLRKVLSYPQIYLSGLLLGTFHFTNFWDFIIYTVVVFVVFLASNLMTERLRKAVIHTAVQMLLAMTVCLVAALPFTMHFQSIFKGVGIAEHHSMLYQLLVLWMIPATVTVIFIVMVIRTLWKDRTFFKISASDMFVFLLGCCAVGLVVIPELVYVRDIYEETHARANTMFKLTYQAFIMFSICSGYIISSLLDKKQKIWKVIAWVTVGLYALTACYFFNAANSWFGGWTNPANRTGTSGLSYLDTEEFYQEKNALLWMKEQVQEKKMEGIVAEAPGDSYSACERVSTVTGLSTVIGWEVHEWLWRDDYGSVAERKKEISHLYRGDEDTTDGVELTAKEIIDKYGIQYVYFGTQEEKIYGKECEKNIRTLGNVVYEDDAVTIVKTKN